MLVYSSPGGYIEEIREGVHTITGVATSITAFIGWAANGPTDKAQRIFSWQDFERYFGGPDSRSLLGYAVSSFFTNGGTDAYVIRLADSGASPAAVTVDSRLDFQAKNAGCWGNHFRIRTVISPKDSEKFLLQVLYFATADDPVETHGVVVESFVNLSLDPADEDYAVDRINRASEVLRVKGTGSSALPPADSDTAWKLAGGSDGTVLLPDSAGFENLLTDPAGAISLLGQVDLFNILCVPGETTPLVIAKLEAWCRKKRAFLLVDCREDATFTSLENGPDVAITGEHSINAAYYFPWLKVKDPRQKSRTRHVPPCGFMAGIYSRTDSQQGVWKAPAGAGAGLYGISGVKVTLSDTETGILNPEGINCIRHTPVFGTVAWGARTLRGDDRYGSEYTYVPVRRLALYIEESLFRGTQWVIFEPNDEPLWAQIRLNIGEFMQDLFRQGAFQGDMPKEAYFVKCDKMTTTQDDINQGIINIVVGFAPIRPAEFIVIRIQQIAGQVQTLEGNSAV